MPPSKAKSDPLYDDRMLQVLRAVDVEGQLDIRELLVCAASMTAAHVTTARPTIAQLVANFVVDDTLADPAPTTTIALVDDVLTTGAHFVAAKAVLASRFPGASIRGLFVARRVLP